MKNHGMALYTDSYKFSHHLQYPPETEYVSSYYESRGGAFDEIVFFGLQYLLEEYVIKPVTQKDVDLAYELAEKHLGNKNIFNKEGWDYIVKEHGGYLPVVIRAVPEGSVVPTHNILMDVTNTDPKCAWVTNYIETLITTVWYPCTVATQSREMKKIIKRYADKTADDMFIDFKLHDFGFRGSTSVESSALGGAAHLVNFQGTDTFSAILLLREYYDADMAGFSIPAAEHSTITSWTREKEAEAYRNMLEKFPDGLVAVVSDSYDIYNACENLWGTELKELIENRNGTLVVRPDSGNPPEVVVNVLNILGNKFGYTLNSKGYKVLPPFIRVIQGDGIDISMLDIILENMERNGWSVENIAFGSGGGLLQKVNRDTCRFAFKCSSVVVDGEERDTYKDPITDSGKRSKRGRLDLVSQDGVLTTVKKGDTLLPSELKTVYMNGVMLERYTLEEVRERAKVV